MVGIYLEPSCSTPFGTGSLSFGGVDYSKVTSDVHFTYVSQSQCLHEVSVSYLSGASYSPRTQVQNSSFWWGLDQTVTYGNSTPIFPESAAGMVDSSTTFIYFGPGTYLLQKRTAFDS